MNTREFLEEEADAEHFIPDTAILNEANPSTKLERRRRIEDLFEEKRLKEELKEFG